MARKKGQRHKLFEESFDAKECYSTAFIAQKLLYMHHNPVKGKWNLVNDFAMFEHSSAGFYYSTGADPGSFIAPCIIFLVACPDKICQRQPS